MPKTTYQKGKQVEKQAEKFLWRQGLKTIQCNYRTRFGEIDLIMNDGQTVVFVEVRYRKSNYAGSALDSIDTYKQRRIIATAQYYLGEKVNTTDIRFDVVTYDGNSDTPSAWLRNAFDDEA